MIYDRIPNDWHVRQTTDATITSTTSQVWAYKKNTEMFIQVNWFFAKSIAYLMRSFPVNCLYRTLETAANVSLVFVCQQTKATNEDKRKA